MWRAGRNLISALGVMAILAYGVGLTTADVVVSDDFNDGYLDPSIWVEGPADPNVTVEEAGGVLTLTDQGGSAAQVSTVHAFLGNFDAWVDFDLLQFPSDDNCHASLRLVSTGAGNNRVVIKRHRGSGVNRYTFLKYVDGTREVLKHSDTEHESGKLRIERVASQFTAYYWDGSWQVLESTSHFSGPTLAEMDAFGTDNEPTVSVAYDNFQITATDMTGNLSGTVYNAVGGPIAAAEVTLTDEPSTQTEADGLYSFMYLLSRPRTLTVTKDAYFPATEEVTIESGINGVADVTMILIGDLDADCDVGLSDLAQLLSNYGMTSGATYADGDMDGDGDVQLEDLSALLPVYNQACP